MLIQKAMVATIGLVGTMTNLVTYDAPSLTSVETLSECTACAQVTMNGASFGVESHTPRAR